MENIEIREYIRPLLKWWWLLLLSTLVAGVASGIYTYRQPLLYRSGTTLMVGSAVFSPNPSANDLYLGNQLALAHAEMARRATVREATQRALGLSWLPSYSVWAVPNTQLIEISVTDANPQLTLMVVEELVRQLIGESDTASVGAQEQREAFIDRQLDSLEQSIEETNAEKARLEQELLGMFSAREIANTRTQIDALDTKIAAHQANYSALLARSQRSATNTLSVIEPAYLPTRPLSRNLAMNVLLAAALGFALAAVGAYVLEFSDDSIQTDDDVRRQLHLPTLIDIPNLSTDGTDQKHSLVSLHSPSSATDAYAELQYNLRSNPSGVEIRSIVISSPGPNAGKSLTAANLGIAFALAGKKVILIDGDLRSPSLHRTFQLNNHGGLSRFLTGTEEDVGSLLQRTTVNGLSVLTSGPLPLNPTALLGSKRMEYILRVLCEQADIVIMDTPPITAAADASILASQADGILLVISARSTRGKLAKRAVKVLNQTQAKILGVVLNEVSPQNLRYGMLHYGHRVQTSSPQAERPQRKSDIPGIGKSMLAGQTRTNGRNVSHHPPHAVNLGSEGQSPTTKP